MWFSLDEDIHLIAVILSYAKNDETIGINDFTRLESELMNMRNTSVRSAKSLQTNIARRRSEFRSWNLLCNINTHVKDFSLLLGA